MHSRSARETEIKLPLAGAPQGRRLLRRAGFRLVAPRTFEDNLVFDTPQGSLRAQGALLRLRTARRRSVLTYKGPAAPGKHKSRLELEVEVASAPAMQAILQALGFEPVFRYQKYRAEFAIPGQSGLATLDETPLGAFLELEGSPRWIDRTAQNLGFTERDYITASYGRLYLDSCAQRGVPPGDMLLNIRK
jgi:adenylate cyclase, class 2